MATAPNPPATELAAPRCRRKEARPGELIEAALDVFVERGYSGARLDDIAHRAGVTKGTVYLYFKDKEELFEAVVRETLGSLLTRGQAMASGFEGTSAELLRDVIERWWRDIVQSEKISALPKLMIAEAGNFPRLARFYYHVVIEPGRAILREVLERGMRSGEFRRVEVDDYVHFIIAPILLRQCMQHSFLHAVPGMHLGTDSFVESFIEHLLCSLAPPTPARAPGGGAS